MQVQLYACVPYIVSLAVLATRVPVVKKKTRRRQKAAFLSQNQCNVSFRAAAIGLHALVSAAPLSGRHKQAWCVDYKYNPLIIAERMEDFDAGGERARH